MGRAGAGPWRAHGSTAAGAALALIGVTLALALLVVDNRHFSFPLRVLAH